jgi:hypothetical protein
MGGTKVAVSSAARLFLAYLPAFPILEGLAMLFCFSVSVSRNCIGSVLQSPCRLGFRSPAITTTPCPESSDCRTIEDRKAETTFHRSKQKNQ